MRGCGARRAYGAAAIFFVRWVFFWGRWNAAGKCGDDGMLADGEEWRRLFRIKKALWGKRRLALGGCFDECILSGKDDGLFVEKVALLVQGQMR